MTLGLMWWQRPLLFVVHAVRRGAIANIFLSLCTALDTNRHSLCCPSSTSYILPISQPSPHTTPRLLCWRNLFFFFFALRPLFLLHSLLSLSLHVSFFTQIHHVVCHRPCSALPTPAADIATVEFLATLITWWRRTGSTFWTLSSTVRHNTRPLPRPQRADACIRSSTPRVPRL